MEKYSRIKALISLDAIRYNFEQMKKNIKEGTKIIAVIRIGLVIPAFRSCNASWAVAAANPHI